MNFLTLTSPVDIEDRRGFTSYYDSRLKSLKSSSTGKIFKYRDLPDVERIPMRKDILRQISEKLTKYYGTPIDALSWFIVLYFQDETKVRYTFRDIEAILKQLNIVHIGRKGEEHIYNQTSIGKTLRAAGWKTEDKQDHTHKGVAHKVMRIRVKANNKAGLLVDKINPNNIPIYKQGEPSTDYAKRLLAHIQIECPAIKDLGGRMLARVCNLLVKEKNQVCFTPDSFRDRGKKMP